jgi:hypothetical protein
MVSCRICGKSLDKENAADHMRNHAKKCEIPHIGTEPANFNEIA